jgi:5-methylthioadenosine/S-adenosylhomocysteine deaminase
VILRAGWVLPVAAPPIRDGFVEIHGSQIAAVGPWSQRPAGLAAADGYFPNGILLPGFVNPHAHLELSCYAGKIAPMPLWPWLGRLIELRREPGQVERETAATVEGARLCLRAGITCVGDISRRNVAWQALKSVPIRKVCFVELLSIADHPPRDIAELRDAVQSVDEDELLTAGVSPHAPYTVPLDQARAAIDLACRMDRPWTLHLAETREEVAFLRGVEDAMPGLLGTLLRERGMHSPHMNTIEYLRAVAPDSPRGSLAHMNYASFDEFDDLVRLGHFTIYCPRAHTFFGHEPHPFPRLRSAGAAVAIGTDSAASNVGLSILGELRALRAVDPSLAALDALRIVTLKAARAIGMDRSIGSLEVGKHADLVIFDAPQACADPESWLVEQAGEPRAVWVGGVLVDGVRERPPGL